MDNLLQQCPQEYLQALEDLRVKRAAYDFAEPEFEEVAYHEMKAAQARVEALAREMKRERRV